MSFATSLNFTSSNEDGRTELEALDLGPEDRVLCLTASGTRPLDLLMGDPGEVLAIDLNPAQNHLLELKMAAFQILPDDALYAYLGIDPSADRLTLHTRLEPLLSNETRAFWQSKPALIRKGIWTVGRWERVLRTLARLLHLVRGKKLDHLFNARTPGEQQQIWSEYFDDWFWKSSIQLLSSRFFWTHIIGEPGGQFLPDKRETTTRLIEAFREASGQFLFSQSDFASLMLRGQHISHAALPVHLLPNNLETVRKRLDRIRIQTTDLAALDRNIHGRFSAYSLSDFGSYCDAAAYASCWQGVLETAQPTARFCERIFMNRLALPERVSQRVSIDHALSDRLSRTDRAIIYDIRTGQIR